MPVSRVNDEELAGAPKLIDIALPHYDLIASIDKLQYGSDKLSTGGQVSSVCTYQADALLH